jgi:ribosomal protein S20
MAFVLADANGLLRTIIKSIDKKAEFRVDPIEGERPSLAVNMSLRKRSTTVSVPIEQVEAARENSMSRSQLRTTLKRALDKVTFEAMPVASTKMLRGKSVEGGFFRPPQGGRGRR